jgi:VWFA-related protein
MKAFYHVWILLVCSSLGAWAQQHAPTSELAKQPQTLKSSAALPPTPSSEDREIALDVVVTDASGNPVSGLRQQDFTVLDNKAPQDILSFQAISGDTTTADPGVKVLLLIDTVNTSFQNVAYERKQIERFLGQNNGQLAQPVSIVFFSDTGTQIQSESSRDGKALIAALEKNETNLRTLRRSAGFYGAVERFQLSLQTLRSLVAEQSTQPGRKLLIWISPGWPILTGPQVELSAKEQRSLFQSVVQMSQALRQARITLYSVDPLGTADAAGFRTFYYQQFLKGLPSATKAQAGNLALQVLGYQSGGLVLNSSNDVASEIAKCVKDAIAYYRMSFHNAPTERRGEYHQLKVLIDKPGLTARTRTGYYAQP